MVKALRNWLDTHIAGVLAAIVLLALILVVGG
jgi:hypothetical protein